MYDKRLKTTATHQLRKLLNTILSKHFNACRFKNICMASRHHNAGKADHNKCHVTSHTYTSKRFMTQLYDVRRINDGALNHAKKHLEKSFNTTHTTQELEKKEKFPAFLSPSLLKHRSLQLVIFSLGGFIFQRSSSVV